MEHNRLQIKNYKCFDEDGCWIEPLKSINLIIGKNNAGKSSLIELFQFLVNREDNFFKNYRKQISPSIFFEHTITEHFVRQAFPENTVIKATGQSVLDYGRRFIGSKLIYSASNEKKHTFESVDKDFDSAIAKNCFESYPKNIPPYLHGKQFRHLSAERDIKPEITNTRNSLSINGAGATNLIQATINRDVNQRDLVEDILLKELNRIVGPDLTFSRILVQNNPDNNNNNHDTWEIFLESKSDGRVALSKMGSGIKTILLVLISLHIIPIIEKKKIDEYIFAFEELENNLHPSLQRGLYNYINRFAEEKKCKFILTSHSHIAIDLYNALEDAQIYHINRLEEKTTVNTIRNMSEIKNVLDDLDVRASDLLQSNGIIWVEGPSDRTYVNRWLNLIDETLIEGYHYSIMFYGGRLLSNLSFDLEYFTKELIPLLKLNKNAFVLIDRDGTSVSTNLNQTKERIKTEIGDGKVWITQGREIENYLTSNTLSNWQNSTYDKQVKIKTDHDTKLEDIISNTRGSEKIKYNLNKNKYSSEIAQSIKEEDLNVLDLKSNLDNLVKQIRKWNKI
jgi:putative ATP-dependent endonuclease of OLD family